MLLALLAGSHESAPPKSQILLVLKSIDQRLYSSTSIHGDVEPFARCDEASITLLGDLIRQQAAGGGAVLILAAIDLPLLPPTPHPE